MHTDVLRDDMNRDKPQWLKLTDEMMIRVFRACHDAIISNRSVNLDLSKIGDLALFHISGCLYTSAYSNERGLHSAAICLIRQCVEAMTIVDLALQNEVYREPLLEMWKSGKLSSGEIRKKLERDKWPLYVGGLWSEPWSEFFGNLARAVHPYAHYSPQLMGWQMAIEYGDDTGPKYVRVGPAAYEPLKASRITLLHGIVVWTLARITIENCDLPCAVELKSESEALRLSINKSKLLVGKKDWALELLPFMWFRPGHDWRDA